VGVVGMADVAELVRRKRNVVPGEELGVQR